MGKQISKTHAAAIEGNAGVEQEMSKPQKEMGRGLSLYLDHIEILCNNVVDVCIN